MMLPRAVGRQGRKRGQPERGNMNTRAPNERHFARTIRNTFELARDDGADGGLRSA